MRGVRVVALVAVAAAVALALTSWGMGGGVAPRTVALPTSAQTQELEALALKTAKDTGDGHPADMSIVATTERTINKVISGAETADDEDVYAVFMHGQFTRFDVVPPGRSDGPHPTGTEMVLVYGATGANELQLTDFFLGNQATDISALGPVRKLDLSIP